VAYTSARGGSLDIYIMNADGSGERPLTLNPLDDMQPAWSPDGAQIVFASNRGGDFELYTADANCVAAPDLDCAVTALTDNTVDDVYPSWSRDGVIAFASFRDNNWDIYTLDIAGGAGETNITNCPATDEQAPAWSHDGSMLAFMSNRAKLGPGSVPGGCGTSRNAANDDIYIINVDDSDIDTITSSAVPDQYPTWSPNDDRLAFVSTDRDGNNNLYVVNIDNPGEDVEILDGIDGVGFPAWRP
jgi:TolB protein